MKEEFLLSIVVPVYKEEKNISPFLSRVTKAMEENGYNYEVIFCLDPSPDNTYGEIKEHIRHNGNIRLIEFSRRFGQSAATMAGTLNCKGDICVIIDVDLQDPPELISDMVESWKTKGSNVVYAQRAPSIARF